MRYQAISYKWLFLAFLILLLFTITALWVYSKRTRYTHDLSECEDLLETSTLAKRAGANTRFKIAFGIENAFTTIDQTYYLKYRKQIEDTLSSHNTDEYRLQIASSATSIVKDHLLISQEVHLQTIVKILVLRTILSIFFPELPQSTFSDSDIIFLTNTIDALWQDSKSPRKILLATYFPVYSSLIKTRRALHLRIKLLFLSHLPNSTDDIPSRLNPLNVLLPAYKGLWEPILQGFLSIHSQSTAPHNRKIYTQVLTAFLKSPTSQTWCKTHPSSPISTQHLLAETLRLYPPTRRIYTQHLRTNEKNNKNNNNHNNTTAIDIQTLHRTGTIWGPNPTHFDPSRWSRQNLGVLGTRQYIPFGLKRHGTRYHQSQSRNDHQDHSHQSHGKDEDRNAHGVSKCPSRTRGGPKLCAVLLAALVVEIGEGEGEWEVVVDAKEGRWWGCSLGGLMDGWGRDELGRVRLRRAG